VQSKKNNDIRWVVKAKMPKGKKEVLQEMPQEHKTKYARELKVLFSPDKYIYFQAFTLKNNVQLLRSTIRKLTFVENRLNG
jgi:hypothetical protein|tara:strand:- start:6071 stop:6313 length:243 start_codon:yes stop_codon:yes gene_type:complete